MATRPWITPQDVKSYSEIKSVQNRSDSRLAVDIARAEKYITTYTHNDFKDYDPIPDEVKTAAILLAEAYGKQAVSASKEYKSETFDDYAYQANDAEVSLESLDIAALLDDFVVNEPKNGVNMRLRKL